MCYNRTKVVKTRINTGLLAVFDWTQFAQKHKIHSKKRSKFHSAFYNYYFVSSFASKSLLYAATLNMGSNILPDNRV